MHMSSAGTLSLLKSKFPVEFKYKRSVFRIQLSRFSLYCYYIFVCLSVLGFYRTPITILVKYIQWFKCIIPWESRNASLQFGEYQVTMGATFYLLQRLAHSSTCLIKIYQLISSGKPQTKVSSNLSKLIENAKGFRVFKKFILSLINRSNYNPAITKCKIFSSKDKKSKV